MTQAFATFLAQTPAAQHEGSGQWAILLLLGLVATLVASVLWLTMARKRDADAFARLAGQFGRTATTDGDRAAVEAALVDVFGEGPRITDLFRHDLDAKAGVRAYVARTLMPLYRVDKGGAWDERMQESQRKFVVIVTGFAGEMPNFRLMPNNWALGTVRGKKENAFEGVMPFGDRNYVLGRDEKRVSHVLGGPLQQMLRDNRDLTVDGRDGTLAFYSQDIREQPKDMDAFLRRSLEVARVLIERAATATPASAAV